MFSGDGGGGERGGGVCGEFCGVPCDALYGGDDGGGGDLLFEKLFLTLYVRERKLF